MAGYIGPRNGRPSREMRPFPDRPNWSTYFAPGSPEYERMQRRAKADRRSRWIEAVIRVFAYSVLAGVALAAAIWIPKFGQVVGG